MRILVRLLLFLAIAASAPSAQSEVEDTLRIYLVDVEGGNATLFVSPSNESLLIDTGSGGAVADRDVGRIMAAATDAGLRQIDHLITTHWHSDHFGGMVELAKRIPIRHFIDHGPSVEDNPQTVAFVEGGYRDLYTAARRTVVKPADAISLGGVTFTVMASGGERLERPLSGAGMSNPHCANFERQAEDTGENAQSVGVHFTLGRFRGLHLGDLTINKEFDLMCPENPIGTVDLYIVSHHGLGTSNSAPLVHAIEPRVAIMNNGTRKGGNPRPMTTLYSAPGLEDLWQLHFSLLSGQEYTVPGLFVANHVDEQPGEVPLLPLQRGSNAGPPPAHNGPAHWLRVDARRDGSFTVTNGRNGFSKAY
jgi:competence protein ComEC